MSGKVQRETHDIDVFGRFDRPISAILLVISFGRVVWIVIKRGMNHRKLLIGGTGNSLD